MAKKALRHFIPLFVTSCLAGLVLSILGPFGTARLNWLERLVYWVGLCMAGGLGAGLFDALNARFKWTHKPWIMALGQSVGATLCVASVMFLIFPPWKASYVFITLFYIWVVAIVICGFGVLMRQAKQSAAPDKIRPDLLNRLPPKLRSADIYAISAEDHYVRVHTSLGDEMLLMRLSDAIKEIAPLSGERTHRSWWVAEKGVEKTERKDGKTNLFLKNEVIAPVSRSGHKLIKEAGWI